MRSHIATGSKRNIRYHPYVFTEHGAVMLACVLKSSVAVESSVQVVRAFNRLKEYLNEHKDLAMKLDQVQRKLVIHDHQIQTVFNVIAKLQRQPLLPRLKRRRIGFRR